MSIVGGGLANQYTYDADGNRVRASTLNGTTRFLVDAANATGLTQVIEEKDVSGALQARYSYGNELLAMARGGVTAFRLRDTFGSTRALADSAATLTDQYQYDGYGNAVSAVGSTVNPYRYRGERLDEESGLYQLRARSYSPALGRFTTRDPFGGRINAPVSRHRYLYGNADPINNVDPTGHESLVELSLVQSVQAIIASPRVVSAVSAFCTAATTAEQASVAIALTGLGLGLISNIAGISGGKNTTQFAYNSPEIPGRGIKNLAFSGKTGGGTAKIEFEAGVNFHNDTGVVAKLSLPPIELGFGFKVGAEFSREFKLCGVVPVGKLAFKVENTSGVADQGSGAYVTNSYTAAFEASMFKGALTLALPLFEAKQEGFDSTLTLFGGAFFFQIPSPPLPQ